MKKLLATVLVLIMALSIFAGCAKGGDDKTNPPKTDASGNIMPVVTIGIPFSTSVEDYDTNKYTLWLEEQSGIDMEIVQYPSASADYKAKITTQIVGGEELPDLLWRMAIGDTAWKQYADEGYILNLKPMLENKEKSAEFWKRIDELQTNLPGHWENIQRLISYTTVDGEEGWWCFGRWETTLYDTIDYKMFINQTWLTKLGLEMPNSPETLKTVLEAFKTKDPNGNNKADEVPLYASGTASGADTLNWLMNMFECVQPENYWNVDANGKLICPFTTENYRKGLIYCNSLVKAGLMDSSIKTSGTSACKKLMANDPSTLGVVLTHPSLGFDPGNMMLKNYVAMPYWGYVQRNTQACDRNAFVTESAKDNIDDVWKLIMTMMTKESSIWQRYGERGTCWDWADPGTKSWFGRDAEIKILDGDTYWTTVNNYAWHTIGCTILTDAEFENVQMDENVDDEWYKWKMKIQGDNYKFCIDQEKKKPVTTCPELVMTVEETEEIRSIRSNVKNVLTTYRDKFIFGTDGLDPNKEADWKKFLDELNTQGYDQYAAQAQRIYDRMFKS